MSSAPYKTARGRVAALSRSRNADDPDLTAARRDLAAARLEEHIAATVAKAPPLSQDQLDRLVTLLRPAAKATAGGGAG